VNDPLLYVCGAAGALMYAFPMYMIAIMKEPPAKFALQILIFSIFVGGFVAPVFTLTLGNVSWLSWMVKPEPYPLALIIGLLSNPFMPVIVRKATEWADSYQIGDTK